MSKPHQAGAPARPSLRPRRSETATRAPRPAAAGTCRPRMSRRPQGAGAHGSALEPLIEVRGNAGQREASRDHQGAERRRHERQRPRSGSAEQPRPQPQPEEDEAPHVDAVEDDQKGHHAIGDPADADAEAAKRPRGQGDTPCARGREHARRDQAGHRDRIALAPADRFLLVDEDGTEQRDVPREREDLERQRRGEPDRVASGHEGGDFGELGDVGRGQDEHEQRSDGCATDEAAPGPRTPGRWCTGRMVG